jgi:hypothetical protein
MSKNNKTGEMILSLILVGLIVNVIILTVVSIIDKDNLVVMIGFGILMSIFKVRSV